MRHGWGVPGKEGASLQFFVVEAALVEEVAKRMLAGRRLAAEPDGWLPSGE